MPNVYSEATYEGIRMRNVRMPSAAPDVSIQCVWVCPSHAMRGGGKMQCEGGGHKDITRVRILLFARKTPKRTRRLRRPTGAEGGGGGAVRLLGPCVLCVVLGALDVVLKDGVVRVVRGGLVVKVVAVGGEVGRGRGGGGGAGAAAAGVWGGGEEGGGGASESTLRRGFRRVFFSFVDCLDADWAEHALSMLHALSQLRAGAARGGAARCMGRRWGTRHRSRRGTKAGWARAGSTGCPWAR
ncbi:hypothetical protein K438DRAFT_1756839, partial [Mycena galopus ATCC 62051]